MTSLARSRARSRREGGATVIELIVVILILAIIIGPLSGALITGLITTAQSDQRGTDTTDQQTLASYFVNDVQSTDSVSLTSAGCGDTVAGGTVVLHLEWSDPGNTSAVGDDVSKKVAYVATTGKQLHRVACQTPGGNNTVIVVNALTSNPAVECDGAACTAGAKPKVVTMNVSTSGTTSTGPSYETYTFELEATRRVTA